MSTIDAREVGFVPGPAAPQPEFHWDPAGRRPNLVAVITVMAVTLGLSFWFAWKASGVEVAGANVKYVPHVMGSWNHAVCVEPTLDGRWQASGDTGCSELSHRWYPLNTDPEDASLKEAIGADSTIVRQYVNPNTHQIVELYLVYRRYGRREFNHNPDQCFPAGGYQLQKRDTAMLPWAGEQHPVTHMLFDGSHVEYKGGDGQLKEGVPPATVTYFFASGSKTENVFLKQQFWMALERFVPNRNGWTLVRLNTPHVMVNGKMMTDEDALAAQSDFLRDCGDTIRDIITTDKADDPKAGR